MQEISEMLVEFSDSDAVEIFIRDDNSYYRCRERRIPSCGFRFEVIEDGAEFLSKSRLGELRRSVMEGHFSMHSPRFSKYGSFYTGNTAETVSFIERGDGEKGDVQLDIEDGYRSLFLIPIRIDGEIAGVLELSKMRENYFPKREIEFYEGVAQTLGSALYDRKAQAALRERVKELTCLYGIAQVVQISEPPTEEIFQSIARLLPPAFQYPDKAMAQITIDQSSYRSQGYNERRIVQNDPSILKKEILINQQSCGSVEILYPEGTPQREGKPFIEEEYHLISEVSRQISLFIERKQTEDEKLKLQDQLRHADRLATIGELAAGVAHEINEPLGNILGYSQLIKNEQDFSEQTSGDLEKIIKAVLHAREIVKKLLIFAHQLPVKMTKVNLNRIIEEGLDFLESRCHKEGIELIRILSPELPDTTMDASQVNQVLTNLVVNAIQAMPCGGTLTVETALQKAEKQISLIVVDTGVGMSGGEMKQIFIPFFTTKAVGQGTGLGLAVVHGIVTNHGGTIEVNSGIGKGTRFEVRFPLAKPRGGEGRI